MPNQRIHLNNIQLNGYIDYELTYHELKHAPVATSLERVSNLNVHIYSYTYEDTTKGTNNGTYVYVDYLNDV